MKRHRNDVSMTSAKVKAAQLVAAGELEMAEIAELCGISMRTLHNWRKEQAFIDQVLDTVRQTREALQQEGIRVRQNRLRDLDDLRDKLARVVNERAEWFRVNDPNAPGGQTGLVCFTKKWVGNKTEGNVETEYVVDSKTVREWRELLKQGAIEVGEWAEKRIVGVEGDIYLTAEMQAVISKAYGEDGMESDTKQREDNAE